MLYLGQQNSGMDHMRCLLATVGLLLATVTHVLHPLPNVCADQILLKYNK